MLGHLHRPAVLAATVTSACWWPAPAPAAARAGGEHGPAPRYAVIDVGTLGGPQSDVALPGARSRPTEP